VFGEEMEDINPKVTSHERTYDPLLIPHFLLLPSSLLLPLIFYSQNNQLISNEVLFD